MPPATLPGTSSRYLRLIDGLSRTSSSATRRLVAGHVHRLITGNLAGRAVLTLPSTYVQARLTFGSQEIELAPDEPWGFALHAFLDGEVISHVQPVR